MSELPERDDVARKQRRELLVLWAYFIVWTSIALGFFYIFAIRAPSLLGGLITGAMVLLGIGYIWAVTRMTLGEAKFGVVSLTPFARPAIPGGRLNAVLRFHDQPPRIPEIDAELRCVAVTIVKRSNSGVVPTEHVAWSTRQSFSLRHDRADIGFAIPADAAVTDLPGERPSESGWHSLPMEPGKALRYHRWEILVKASVPGMDFERSFPVVIDPPQAGRAAALHKAAPRHVAIPKGVGTISSSLVVVALLGAFFFDSFSGSVIFDKVAKQLAAALPGVKQEPPAITREQGVVGRHGGGFAEQGCNDVTDLHQAVVRDCIGRPGSSKAGLEKRNGLGQTPLALAVLQNKPAMVKALLARGADVNAPIRFGKGERPVSSGQESAQRPELVPGSTPLIMARDAAMVGLLLQAGAAKDVKNGYGWSAVFYYTHHGSVEMLDTLLAAGADINATADFDPSHSGTTALMWAAYMNRTAHLQVLLKYQPKRDIRDAAGKTALDYAKGFSHAEAVRLLSAPAS